MFKAKDVMDYITEVRRELHMYPELAFKEKRTKYN
jgi:metal-dependent amidase/aminoacylase/carboxypeptidase family protein